MHARESNPCPIYILVWHLNHWATKAFPDMEFIKLNTHYRSPDLLNLSFKISSESNLSPSLPRHSQPLAWQPTLQLPLGIVMGLQTCVGQGYGLVRVRVRVGHSHPQKNLCLWHGFHRVSQVHNLPKKKNRIEERYDGSRHLDDVSYIVYCHK